MRFKHILCACLLLVLPSASQAAWFFNDHYYEVSWRETEDSHRLKRLCIGKPWTEGDFTVFQLYPDKREMQIKTKCIVTIVDTGTKSPADEASEREVKFKELFGTNPVVYRKEFSPSYLAKMRGAGFSDSEIKFYLSDIDPLFKNAFCENNLSLNEVADRLLRMRISDPAFNPERPFILKQVGLFDDLLNE